MHPRRQTSCLETADTKYSWVLIRIVLVVASSISCAPEPTEQADTEQSSGDSADSETTTHVDPPEGTTEGLGSETASDDPLARVPPSVPRPARPWDMPFPVERFAMLVDDCTSAMPACEHPCAPAYLEWLRRRASCLARRSDDAPPEHGPLAGAVMAEGRVLFASAVANLPPNVTNDERLDQDAVRALRTAARDALRAALGDFERCRVVEDGEWGEFCADMGRWAAGGVQYPCRVERADSGEVTSVECAVR